MRSARGRMGGSINGVSAVLAALSSVVFLLAGSASANLVVNGDFQSGNVGFTSDYTYSTYLNSPALYGVAADPTDIQGYAHSYFDHTFGDSSGSMMVVNGRQYTYQPNVVWSQTVAVTPGFTYDLSFWHSIWAPGLASLDVRVNSIAIAPVFSAGGALGEWVLFSAAWSSGTSAEAVLELVNTSASWDGNDFSLDDIGLEVQGSSPVERSSWSSIKGLFR